MESNVNPGTLLTWLQTKVGGYGLVVTDMTSSFQNGLAICAIIHRYRPDLIEFASLDPTDIAVNNQPAFAWSVSWASRPTPRVRRWPGPWRSGGPQPQTSSP